MQFPKLTPLQSRLAACLGTSVILVIIYLSLSPSHFAYAAELDSILHDDHNHHRIGVGHSLNLAADIDWSESGNTLDADGFDVAADYQAEFPGVSRELVGRAPPVVAPLKNNNPSATNIAPGETNEYVFASSEVYGPPGTLRTGLPWSISRSDGTAIQKRSDTASKEGAGTDVHDLLRRQATNGTAKTVYISVNTCTQPSANSGQTGTPPQLTLFYSVNESTTSPSLNNNAVKLSFEQGYASAMVNATGNVYFSVVASNLTDQFSGQWHYSIAASIDASYFYYEDTKDTPFIWTVDTDSNSALLATRNLTDANDPEVSDETKALREKWMKMTANPPFTMKIFNTSSPNITGIERSYCGWNTLGMNPVTISYNMTQRGVGQNPKQQFYATGLQPGQNYTAILAYDGVNSTNADVVAGGGQVWKSITFTTKTGMLLVLLIPLCPC
jgi:calcium channel MID1